jgi:hypothetical protein
MDRRDRPDAIVGMMPHPQKGKKRKPNMIQIRALLRLLYIESTCSSHQRFIEPLRPTFFTILKREIVSAVGLARI